VTSNFGRKVFTRRREARQKNRSQLQTNFAALLSHIISYGVVERRGASPRTSSFVRGRFSQDHTVIAGYGAIKNRQKKQNWEGARPVISLESLQNVYKYIYKACGKSGFSNKTRQSFHSQFTDASQRVGNLAIVPIRSKVRGPAPLDPSATFDIIDEALDLFKPLIFFRQFEFKSDADRVMVYLILYILECLRKLQRCNTKAQGSKELTSMSLARFDLPGDPGFPRELSNLYTKPASTADATTMRNYLVQLRTELGTRLLDRVYATDKDQPSKWWLCFAKRKFLDQTLSAPGSF